MCLAAKGSGVIRTVLKRVWHLRQFHVPDESPLRDYVWGSIIVVIGVFTVFGMFFLLGG